MSLSSTQSDGQTCAGGFSVAAADGVLEGPGKHTAHVNPVVALAPRLRLGAEYALVDANIAVISKCASTMSFNSTHVVGHRARTDGTRASPIAIARSGRGRTASWRSRSRGACLDSSVCLTSRSAGRLSATGSSGGALCRRRRLAETIPSPTGDGCIGLQSAGVAVPGIDACEVAGGGIA